MKTLNQFLNEAISPQEKKAQAIVTKHGDADMGYAELVQLMTSNGIPKKVADQVARNNGRNP